MWVAQGRRVLEHPGSLGALLTEPYWPKNFGGRLWRPAVLASFAIDYRVSGSPHWFHAVNVAWAAVATALLTLLAVALAGPRAGLIAGLLFAAHPVHVEATAGVVGRAELMAAVGFALALLSALKAAADRRWLTGIALGSLLAIASKESGATLPFVLLVLLVWRGRRLQDTAVPVLVAAAPVALYFALRALVTAGAFDTGGLAPGLEGLSLLQRSRAMLGVSLQWWRLLFFPAQLSADYSPAQLVVSVAMTWRHWLAAALWILAGVLSLRLRAALPALALAYLWIVLTLAPVANVLVPTEILVAERTLYLPSFGAVLAVGAALAALPWTADARRWITGVLVAAGGVFSMARANTWYDPEHWYWSMQVDAPKSYRTLWLRGNAAFRDGHWGGGERLLRLAMTAAPGIPGPREDLAGYYAQAHDWAPAEAMLTGAMPLNWTRTKPWLQLSSVMLQEGDSARAAAWSVHTAQRFPESGDVVREALSVLLLARQCYRADSLLTSRRAQLQPSAVGATRQQIEACSRRLSR